MIKARTVFSFLIILAIFHGIVFADLEENFYAYRTVYIKIVTDKAFRSPAWQKIVKELVRATSLQFSQQFRIKFEIKEIEDRETFLGIEKLAEDNATKHNEQDQSFCRIFMGIQKEDKERTQLLNQLVQGINPSDCDIIFCFTGKHCKFSARVNNIPGRFVLLSLKGENKFSKVRILVHEIGHLFGANHTDIDEAESVMFWGTYKKSLKFDKKNREIILKNKWLDFKKL